MGPRDPKFGFQIPKIFWGLGPGPGPGPQGPLGPKFGPKFRDLAQMWIPNGLPRAADRSVFSPEYVCFSGKIVKCHGVPKTAENVEK